MGTIIQAPRDTTPPAPVTVVAGQPVAAEDLTVMGDALVQQMPDNRTRIFVGAQRGMENAAYTQRRIVRAIDPDCYVPANMYQSIMNAATKVRQVWGSPGERWWGAVEIPPDVHLLNGPLEWDFPQNLTLRGEGVGGDEITPYGTSVLDYTNGGHATTELVAPNSDWCIKIKNSGGAGSNFSGFRIENLGLRSRNGSGGGIYAERISMCSLRNVRVYGFTSGYGVYFTRVRDAAASGLSALSTAGDTQYNAFDRVVVGECKYGMRMYIADATMNHCLISNGNNGLGLISGSIGLWEQGGSNRTQGLLIQGHDTLLQSDEDQPSFHSGLRLEYFYSFGIRVFVGSSANHGWTAYCQSLNNSLGWTSYGATADIGVSFENGVKNCYFKTRHMAATTPARIRNATNTAWINPGVGDGAGYGVNNSNTIDYWNN